jgi:hypothetical protein
MIMMRKGVERTMTTERAKLKKTGTTTTMIMVERKGMTTKREVGKWWEELSTNLRRRMMMTKDPKNVVQIGKKIRVEITELGR